MKPRIRHTLLVDLAARSRLLQGARLNSSSSSSTSTASPSTSNATRKSRPRQTDFADEWRDQTLASDALLSSSSGGSSSKPFRPTPARRGLASHTEEPVLKKNPYADQYKLKDENHFEDAEAESTLLADGDRHRRKTNEALADSLVDRLREPGSTKRDAQTNKRKDKVKWGLLSNGTASTEGSAGSNMGGQGDAITDELRSIMDNADNAPNRDEARDMNKIDRLIQFKTAETIEIKDGFVRYTGSDTRYDKPFDVSYHRLRDACPCPKCVDPSTRQRTHTSPEAYREIVESAFSSGTPDQFMLAYAKNGKEEGLQISWSPTHTAFFPLSRFRALSSPQPALESRLPNQGKRVLWLKSKLEHSRYLHVQYTDLANGSTRDDMLLNTLDQLHRFGIVVIKGVPTDKTGDQDCSLREVMGWIGEIRNTFYGETWNVRNVANSKNVAYTDVNLGLHMDLLYFSSPPRFQALHCLRNRVEGGSSYFVDSFSAADHILRDNNADDAYYTPPTIDYEYDNDGHYLACTHPLMPSKRKALHRLYASVNWSPPFQGVPSAFSGGRSTNAQIEWYKSLEQFERTLKESNREWEFRLEEGDLVLFDNRRVLHARRAFRDLTEAERLERGVEVIEGEPSRWLKGCYLDGEVVWDKLATLNRQINGDQIAEL